MPNWKFRHGSGRGQHLLADRATWSLGGHQGFIDDAKISGLAACPLNRSAWDRRDPDPMTIANPSRAPAAMRLDWGGRRDTGPHVAMAAVDPKLRSEGLHHIRGLGQKQNLCSHANLDHDAIGSAGADQIRSRGQGAARRML